MFPSLALQSAFLSTSFLPSGPLEASLASQYYLPTPSFYSPWWCFCVTNMWIRPVSGRSCHENIVICWVTQKLPQIYTENHATFPIRIRKITVQICGNFWVSQYVCPLLNAHSLVGPVCRFVKLLLVSQSQTQLFFLGENLFNWTFNFFFFLFIYAILNGTINNGPNKCNTANPWLVWSKVWIFITLNVL